MARFCGSVHVLFLIPTSHDIHPEVANGIITTWKLPLTRHHGGSICPYVLSRKNTLQK